jgi:pimeloyl-ACP methyl ester carboxylesterase
MPRFDNGETSIYYEEHGRGFPLLLIAPGAMNSTVEMWAGAAINPLALYGEDFRLIAMDQRNAGRSTGPLDIADPWGSFANDQLALLDHLGVGAFHVMGCCIGGSFVLKLIEQAPTRVAAAVLEQPIAIANDNGHLFEAMWRTWGSQLAAVRADIDTDTGGVRDSDVGWRFRAQCGKGLRPVLSHTDACAAWRGRLSPRGPRTRDRRAGPSGRSARAVEG